MTSPLEDAGAPALLLFVRPVLDENVGHHVGGDRRTHAGTAHVAPQFFVLDQIEEEIPAGPAIFLGHRESDQARIASLAPELRRRALALLFPLQVVGFELLLVEAPAGLAELLVLFREYRVATCAVSAAILCWVTMTLPSVSSVDISCA